jgi:EmrB/QacA subfamily drug resistance transporter
MDVVPIRYARVRPNRAPIYGRALKPRPGVQFLTPVHQPTKSHVRTTVILACLAQFMVVLDVSVVNVALPSIRHALGFTEDGLQWVVNAYTITFAGFLLLGGRAADLFGRRRVFVLGLVLFALASLGGGLATSSTTLIVMRLAQGLAGAIVAPASLTIITTSFDDPTARNRAVGIWAAMGGAGGAAGVLLGGLLTEALGWRWILFINVPIGLLAAIAAERLIAEGRREGATRNFDLTGALSATVGLSLLVFGIVRTDTTGWGDAGTLGLIFAGLALLGVFVLIEGWIAKEPLMPLGLFRSRSLTVGNLMVALLAATTFGMWFFLSLYLQQIRGYSPLLTGLIFLPMTLVMVAGSALVSRIMIRFGPRTLQVVGMLLLTAGMLLFSRLSVDGSYLGQMLLPSLISSIGVPFAFIPSTITATSGVKTEEAGLASAITNNARLFGGALGLAILAAIAASRTAGDLHHPTLAIHTTHQALLAGFHLAFLVGGALAFAGVFVAGLLMPARQAYAHGHGTRPVAIEF